MTTLQMAAASDGNSGIDAPRGDTLQYHVFNLEPLRPADKGRQFRLNWTVVGQDFLQYSLKSQTENHSPYNDSRHQLRAWREGGCAKSTPNRPERPSAAWRC